MSHPNPDQLTQQIRDAFESLLALVSSSSSASAYEVERSLFERLLALGRQLLTLFFVCQASQRSSEPVHAADGTPLRYHSQRQTSYYSVFGKIQFPRAYYYAPGHGGVCPLDEALSLPARCYSDLLRDWAEYGLTDASYGESLQLLEHIFGLSLSKQALETSVQEDGVDVEDFYAQKPAPPAEQEGAILVVQADGKGVPMVREETASPPARRGKGQKRTQKKESVVTAVYTIAPYERTAEQVVQALMREQETPPSSEAMPSSEAAASHPPATSFQPETSQRPQPVGKEVRATLEGKAVALERLAQQAAKREGNHLQHRVALTDGDEALQRQMQEHFPQHALVLDLIHASEYLWQAANALLGETHPQRQQWVRQRLTWMLEGQTTRLIADLQTQAQEPSLSESQRQSVNKAAGYYQRNQAFMHYDRYLQRGWPLGTGVVEGACGHLVKDRCERSGMRWTPEGVQPLLDLRAVRLNGDWQAYQDFHRQQQHQRLYGSGSTDVSSPPHVPEVQMLQTQRNDRSPPRSKAA